MKTAEDARDAEEDNEKSISRSSSELNASYTCGDELKKILCVPSVLCGFGLGATES